MGQPLSYREAAFWDGVADKSVQAQQEVPRLRFATITDAVSPFSYSIQYSSDQDPIAGVGRLSSVVPIIGDQVAVMNVDGLPFITAVRGRGPIAETDGTDGNAVTGSATYVSSGSTGDIIDVEMVIGQKVWVQVSSGKCKHTLGTGHAAIMSFKVTGAETYGPNDKDGFEVDDGDWEEAQRQTLFVATANGTHTFTLQYKAVNGADASFWFRRLNIWE